jgi:hypothetical protein
MAVFCEQGDQSLDRTKVCDFCGEIDCSVLIIGDVHLMFEINKGILME